MQGNVDIAIQLFHPSLSSNEIKNILLQNRM